MEYCFNHKDRHSAAQCPYCAKYYCADCLLLQGPLKRVICVNCFATLSERLTKSVSRRKLYIVVGVLAGAPSFLYGLAALFTSNASSTIFVLLGISLAVATSINIIRIRQAKEFLTFQKYAAEIGQSR